MSSPIPTQPEEEYGSLPDTADNDLIEEEDTFDDEPVEIDYV